MKREDTPSPEPTTATSSTAPKSPGSVVGERPSSATSSSCPLPEGFTPGDDDVICGRGKKCYNHIGNERFRLRVMGMLDEYSQAKSKLDKSSVLSRVVDQVRQNSPKGGFVKQDSTTGRWYEVGDFLAREKTSQAFRDALHDRYKSSNLSKKKRRQEEQAKASDTYHRIARSEYEISSRLERLSNEVITGHGVNRYRHAGYGLNRLSNMNIPSHSFLSSGSSPSSFRPVHSGRTSFGHHGISSVSRASASLNRLHQQAHRNFPDPLFGGSSNANVMPSEMGSGRVSGSRSKPRAELFDSDDTHYRSMPDLNFDFGSSTHSLSQDPFMDPKQFQKLYNSMPNIPFSSSPSQLESVQEKIPSSMNISSHHDLKFDLDPIPFDEIKLAQPEKKEIPTTEFKKVSSAPASSNPATSAKLSKDLLECLGKLTEHSIMDDFEPLPLSSRAQVKQQVEKGIDDDDVLEFGEG